MAGASLVSHSVKKTQNQILTPPDVSSRDKVRTNWKKRINGV